jgi:aspartate carbamoyltransferase catalytic subunit
MRDIGAFFYYGKNPISISAIIDKKQLYKASLKGKSIVSLFYENSTRTKLSFALAGKYLGATFTDLGISTSSVTKGESLIDTGITIDQMGADVVIIRHGMTGAPHILAKNIKASVISGGDGTNEHPTQALLDLYTIYDVKQKFKGLKVAIIGDVAHSRVARSNVFGLTKLGANVVLSGPSTLASKGLEVLGATVTNNIRDAVADADVVMGLRVQLERQKGGMFPDLREYAQLFGIDERILKMAKKDALLMHPGPVNRGVELTSDIIDGTQSVINVQVKNGVAIRMAVLSLLTKGRE